MGWQTFEKSHKAEDTPTVTLSKNHFYFSAVASRLADMDRAKGVVYLVDAELRKIGFDFQRGERSPSSYALFRKRGGSGFRSSINDLSARLPWVRAASLSRDACVRRYRLNRDGKIWYIQLCPAFENRFERGRADEIPAEAAGVYRYVRKDGEVVYIGKGNVRSRLGEAGRDEWDFDRIEYSLVGGSELQCQWESWWLEQYKQSHGGRLPPYNAVSGQRETPETIS